LTVLKTTLNDCLVIEPEVFRDVRGFFLESWNERTFSSLTGIDIAFVQDNHSRSTRGVLRGLHFQRSHPQGKLVRVSSGSVWDVAVDLRRSSTTFGRHFGIELSDVNHRQMWIPPGFAHGFLVLSEFADFQYKTTDYWMPEYECCLRWNDPDTSIKWPLDKIQGGSPEPGSPTLTQRDRNALSLAQLQVQGLIYA